MESLNLYLYILPSFHSAMNKKAALELPVNMLVVVIISIVILASGITLMYKFVGGAEDFKKGIDAKTDAELERLLTDQGQKVALPLYTATVERGGTHVFGVGILSIMDGLTQFRVQVELSKVADAQEQDITASVDKMMVEKWVLYNPDLIGMEQNEHRKEAILVSVDDAALPAQYIFNVKILLADGNQYGNTQKFVVMVE